MSFVIGLDCRLAHNPLPHNNIAVLAAPPHFFRLMRSIGGLASDNGEVLGHGFRFLLYLQATYSWKNATEKDETGSQRTINAEQQPRTVGLRKLPMFGMPRPMSISLKSTSILR